MTTVFDCLGWTLYAVGTVFTLARRYSTAGMGWYALAEVAWAAENALQHDRRGLLIAVALFTVFVWYCWNGGGGDRTKRRLRALARTFTGVRRTAPRLT